MSSGIEHHSNDPFHMAIGRRQSADVHVKVTRNGGPNLRLVENLSFDLAAFEYVSCERSQDCFLAKARIERFHMSRQSTLVVANLGEKIGKPLPIPLKSRPALTFMDIQSPTPCGDYGDILRKNNYSPRMLRLLRDLRKVLANPPAKPCFFL